MLCAAPVKSASLMRVELTRGLMRSVVTGDCSSLDRFIGSMTDEFAAAAVIENKS